jgi:hypothetical protein
MAYSMGEHVFVETFCDIATAIFMKIQYATGTSKVHSQAHGTEV